jgi:hypothetical protein
VTEWPDRIAFSISNRPVPPVGPKTMIFIAMPHPSVRSVYNIWGTA